MFIGPIIGPVIKSYIIIIHGVSCRIQIASLPGLARFVCGAH